MFAYFNKLKSAGNDTLPLSAPKTGVFIDNDHHQLRIRDFLHVTSPRINEAKFFNISPIACRCTYIKKTQ